MNEHTSQRMQQGFGIALLAVLSFLFFRCDSVLELLAYVVLLMLAFVLVVAESLTL